MVAKNAKNDIVITGGDIVANKNNLSDEQVTEIVQKKKPKNGFEVMKDFGAAPGENAKFIRFALASWDLPPIDISDPEQVKERLNMYFKHCAENDRKPQIVGMCNWLGISRQTLNEWVRGETRAATHGDIIKKAVSFVEEMWADYMQSGKLNPASGIFLAKNWYGYKDVADVVVTPNNPMQDLDADQARKRITDAIPVDDDE